MLQLLSQCLGANGSIDVPDVFQGSRANLDVESVPAFRQPGELIDIGKLPTALRLLTFASAASAGPVDVLDFTPQLSLAPAVCLGFCKKAEPLLLVSDAE